MPCIQHGSHPARLLVAIPAVDKQLLMQQVLHTSRFREDDPHVDLDKLSGSDESLPSSCTLRKTWVT